MTTDSIGAFHLDETRWHGGNRETLINFLVAHLRHGVVYNEQHTGTGTVAPEDIFKLQAKCVEHPTEQIELESVF